MVDERDTRTNADGEPDGEHRPHGASVLPFPKARPRPEPDDDQLRLRDLIGDVLRDERHDQRRTLADVADAAGVSLPYLSEVERGRKEVSSDVLAAICDALELPLVDLLDRSVRRLRVRPQRTTGFQLRAA
jgi:DNA-binding Xre family transcriptional regulator